MFEAMGGVVPGDSGWREAARDWFERELAGRETRVVVALAPGGEVVSCAMGRLRHEAPSPANPSGVAGAVSNVVTLPGWRGRGLARACLAGLLAWFEQETDAGVLELFATADGSSLYEALGFRVTDWPAMRRSVGR